MPQRLYDAADRGDAAAVAEFLREGDDANEAANDWAPLHVACFKGHFDAVKALLDGGADVKATVRDEHEEARHRGATPLHMAARHGSVVVVNLLLERGADVDAANKNGVRALLLAAQEGHVDAIKALLEAHADVDAANNNGDRAFDLAVKNGHTAAIHLIEGGAAIHLIEPLEPRVELAREADSSSSTLEERIRTLEADNRALRAMVLGWGEGRWAHPDVPQPDEEVEKFKVSGRQWG